MAASASKGIMKAWNSSMGRRGVGWRKLARTVKLSISGRAASKNGGAYGRGSNNIWRMSAWRGDISWLAT